MVHTISKFNPQLHVCREGDYSPVDLAWCALLSAQEYEMLLEKYKMLRDDIINNTVKEHGKYIVTYTKISTDIPGFYKEMEAYEVYNGRMSLNELKELILTRFQNFTEQGYLFECAFFQNIIEDLILFHMCSDEEILEFYRKLSEVAAKKDFVLLYLYSDKLEENIEIIKKERCDGEGKEAWYQMMLEYLSCSPYGKKNGCSTFDDLINHLKHRQQLELNIIREALGEKAVILPAKEYDVRRVLALSGYNIRPMERAEYGCLDDFLYEAIFIPEGVAAPPREIINDPQLQVYVQDFGVQEGDICYVAETEGKIIGAVWVRIMEDYGHVEDGVPSFAVSLYKEYRGRGIGTAMMKQMLEELKKRGYEKTSLAVQKANYAVKMYKNVGFKIVDENEEEYIMVCELNLCG